MSALAEMTVLNVQMGLAVHIKAPNGKWIVVDLGSSSIWDDNSEPAKTLRNCRVSYMVITHPHMDHISDIMNFSYAKPAILLHCPGLSDEEILAQAGDDEVAKSKYQAYIDIINSYSSPVPDGDSDDPDVSSNYGGLSIKTFSTSACDHSNINNFSVITVLTLGNAKVVICGDNEKESLDILMQRSEFKDAVKNAYVLVAPHHGRESAYHSAFVSLVNPYVSIISDGKYHDYSASSKYSSISKGYQVNERNGSISKRSCLTTRNDGDIKVTFGTNDDTRYSGTLSIELI